MRVTDEDDIDGFTSRENVLRIQLNDPSLKDIVLSIDAADGSHILLAGDIEALGWGIGQNTHLRKLVIDTRGWNMQEVMGAHIQEAWTETIRLLYEGISQNRSIEHLLVTHVFRIGTDIIHFLPPFLEHNNNFKYIHFCDKDECPYYSRLTRDNMRSIMVPLLKRDTPFEKLDLSHCEIDDDLVEALLTPLQASPAMSPKEIDFGNNNIGGDGCRSIATLLRDQRCSMETLNLTDNAVKNSLAILFANALIRNTYLKELNIGDIDYAHYSPRFSVTTSGLRAFSQTLCNTSNINATYSSNHTLQVLEYGETYKSTGEDSDSDSEIYENPLHSDICQYLSWNTNDNKTIVARKKVFMKHFLCNFTMEPFKEMEPELLVGVLHFMDKASDENYGLTNLCARNLIIFQLITKNPMICGIVKTGVIENCHNRKRKYG